MGAPVNIWFMFHAMKMQEEKKSENIVPSHDF